MPVWHPTATPKLIGKDIHQQSVKNMHKLNVFPTVCVLGSLMQAKSCADIQTCLERRIVDATPFANRSDA